MKRRAFVTAAAASIGHAALLSSYRAFGRPPGRVDRVQAITGSGREFYLTRTDIAQLRGRLRGPLLLQEDAGYDDARRIWNAAFDRKPALIVRCAGAADVVASVQFAKAHDLLVAVRCGGHSSGGKSVCDHGLMIDLSSMRSVRVDPARRTARVEGGALLGDLDREALAFGLVTTTGTVSHTGVGGLTLGGGLGHLGRQFGLTIDNLLAADMVPANGQLTHVSDTQSADLFWGIRGGGGNFGVVTSFEFRLHEFDGSINSGHLIYPLAQAKQVLRFLAQYAAQQPDHVTFSPTLISTPDNQRILDISLLHTGHPEAAERVLRPIAAAAKPTSRQLETLSYLKLQTKNDVETMHGQHGYLKSGFARALDDALIDAAIASIEDARLPIAQVLALPQLGGAIARVAPQATAFPHRDAAYMVLITAMWRDPALSNEVLGWARSTWARVQPATRGVYVNFLTGEDEPSRTRESYGLNFERLVQLKSKYDRTNLFRLNANIEPTAAPA